ncbi:MAG: AI-2E family transporter [Anaerolineales bacterium]|nr:AI-2E family transporter [Anaerolineales bacterium]
MALIQGSTYLDINNFYFALMVIGFYWLVQVTENNLIVPRVLGDAVELPPLVVMVGVFIGASVGGIIGALLAAPIIASAREVLSYLYAKLWGQEPFPPKTTQELSQAQPSLEEQLKSMLIRLQSLFRGRSRLPGPEKKQAETSEN